MTNDEILNTDYLQLQTQSQIMVKEMTQPTFYSLEMFVVLILWTPVLPFIRH